MSTKFASGAVGTWTKTTRILHILTSKWTAGGAPAAADIGKAVVWIDQAGTSAYTMEIESVATNLTYTDITVKNKGTLPNDANVDAIGLLDLVTTHSYASYLAEITGNVQDDASKLTASEVDQAVASAVSKFGEDEPWVVSKRIQGNGTKEYLLTSILPGLWKLGDTTIVGIEFPEGDDPPSMLEHDEYGIYDDGTAQDGSNLTLRFVDETPANTQYFVVSVRTENSLTVVGQNFPDTAYNFRAICLLASSYCCRRLAAAYAQSSDSTITADVVNYHDKTERYLRLAGYYQEEYNRQVFGTPTPTGTVQAATIERSLKTTASDQGSYLFHPRR
jgi:hypothetical protein